MDAQRGINGVALAPICPVEHHRGQQQRRAKGDQGSCAPLPFPHEGTDQPQTAPSQHNIPQDGEQLDEIQVRHTQIGDGGHEIEVGHVVVPHAARDGGKTTIFLKIDVPVVQKVLIIQAGVVQAQRPNQHSRPNGQQHDQRLVRAARLPPHQRRSQRRQPQQQQRRKSAAAPFQRCAHCRASRQQHSPGGAQERQAFVPSFIHENTSDRSSPGAAASHLTTPARIFPPSIFQRQLTFPPPSFILR